jgi:hypothetical protein
MKKLLPILIILLLISTIANAEKVNHGSKIASRKELIKEKLAKLSQFDTVRDSGYWKRALMHGKLDTRDTTVLWPKFLKFCVDVYNWGDTTFNSYDKSYVHSTGKRWKIFLKSDNWVNSYAMHFANHTHLFMLSDPAANFGITLAFMAVSVGYMKNMNNLIGGQPVTHKKLDFQFCCARFAADAYYSDDKGNTFIKKFGDYNNGHLIDYKFDGIKLRSYGVDAYYFFNNRHYSQGAVYNFAKFQVRNSGSLIAGVSISHQNITLDFTGLPEEMQNQLPDENRIYRFKYNDYCLLLGYGYNWVLGKHWICNLTNMPAIGYKNCFASSIEGRQRQRISLNLRAKFSFIYNKNQFFLGFLARYDARWYIGSDYNFFNSKEDLTICSGFRF